MSSSALSVSCPETNVYAIEINPNIIEITVDINPITVVQSDSLKNIEKTTTKQRVNPTLLNIITNHANGLLTI